MPVSPRVMTWHIFSYFVRSLWIFPLRIWLHAKHDLLHVFPLASVGWTIWRDASWKWKVDIRKRIIPRELQRKSQQHGVMWKCPYLLPAFINLFPTAEILSSWIFAMTLCDTCAHEVFGGKSEFSRQFISDNILSRARNKWIYGVETPNRQPWHPANTSNTSPDRYKLI